MEERMKVLGKTIICMDKESTNGVMEDDMMVNTIWTKNMGMGCTIGLMEDDMRVSGEMANNMVKASILCQMA